MSKKKQLKWAELSQAERIVYLDNTINKKILFSTKLLLEYLENLKKLDQKKNADKIKLIEEGFKDRLIKLGVQVNEAYEFIIEENLPTTNSTTFLTSNTDFGKMLPGVE